jgi:SAM-dependent methyltransferase
MQRYAVTTDNRYVALRGIDTVGQTGVEIGPLDRPLVRRGDSRIFYADHCSTEALRAKYEANPDVDVADIVEVDFDLSATPLGAALASVAPLDYVVASHVAEHVPDLVQWLTDIHASLRPGGVLALVLPDKRFSLDLHRRETPWFEVERAHAERRTRPGLDTVLDHVLNIVQVHTNQLWRDHTIGREAPRTASADIAPVVSEQWHRGEYIDVHCWVVTPWSFLDIVGRIVTRYGLGFRLRLAEPTPLNHLEFYLQLERMAPGAEPTDWRAAVRSLRRRALRPELPDPVSRLRLAHRHFLARGTRAIS